MLYGGNVYGEELTSTLVGGHPYIFIPTGNSVTLNNSYKDIVIQDGKKNNTQINHDNRFQ